MKACRKLARLLWWKPTRPPILDPSPEARLAHPMFPYPALNVSA